MSAERVGIVLTAGFEPNHPMDVSKPAHPDLRGRFRCAMASYALKAGIIDKLYVVGGMPDNRGFSVEEGHADYARRLVSNTRYVNNQDLQDRIGLLPRPTYSTETIKDLRYAVSELKQRGEISNVTVISDDFHLYPRTWAISKVLGQSNLTLLSAEKLLYEGWWPFKDTNGIIKKMNTLPYKAKRMSRELALTWLLLTDYFPGLKGIAEDVISRTANRERLKKNK